VIIMISFGGFWTPAVIITISFGGSWTPKLIVIVTLYLSLCIEYGAQFAAIAQALGWARHCYRSITPRASRSGSGARPAPGNHGTARGASTCAPHRLQCEASAR
jgi:predicted histidine transporter YuiF (NhaC family)